MSVTDFDDIVSGIDAVEQFAQHRAMALLDNVLEGSGGVLSHKEAIRLAELTGFARRTLYRWAKSWPQRSAATPVEAPVYDTFLDAIDAEGPMAFRFDELALTMLYLLNGNMTRFRDEVCAYGTPMPSLPTLSRMWHGQVPPLVRDGAKHGQLNRYKKLFYVRHSAQNPDDAWQLDAFSLDLRMLVEDTSGGAAEEEVIVIARRGWMKVRPQLLLLIDDCSRFITAWALLDHEPTAADTCCLFADAFEVRPDDAGTGVAIGGPPARIVCDNAGAFRALLVEGAVAEMGFQLAPTPAYTPPAKGKVERVGQTIQASVVNGVAGVVTEAVRRNGEHALEVGAQHWLRFGDVESIVAEVVHRYNYEHVHSALGTTPFEAFSKRPGPRRHFDDETLAPWYLPLRHAAGIRKLHPVGVKALGEHWLDPGLDPELIDTEVQVRSLHHRLDRLAMFSGDGETFHSMLTPSTELTEEERSKLVASRIAQGIRVSHYAKNARQTLEERTAAMAANGDESPVTAAVNVVVSNNDASNATPDDAPAGTGAEAVEAADAPTVSETEPKPANGKKKTAAKKAPAKKTASAAKPSPKQRRSGARPASRPGRQRNDTSEVPAARTRRRGRRTDEAALDAELAEKK